MPVLQAVSSGMQGWEKAWIPVFTTLFGILDLSTTLTLIVWELFIKIFFPILNAVMPYLFPALEGFGCCLSAPFCCLREGIRAIIVFLIDVINGFLGFITFSFITGENVEIIPRTAADGVLCTDNEIPGGYLCECASFYS